MPCYNTPIVKIIYPPGCDPTPVPVISSDQVRYDGPNLSCTGVQTGDCLNTVLEKIDEKICSEELVASIIQTIANNDVLKAYFCQLVSSCSPTTTTTTSSSTSTTTTTTTCIPNQAVSFYLATEYISLPSEEIIDFLPMTPEEACISIPASSSEQGAVSAFTVVAASFDIGQPIRSTGCFPLMNGTYIYLVGNQSLYQATIVVTVEDSIITSISTCPTTTTTTTTLSICSIPTITNVVPTGGHVGDFYFVNLSWSTSSPVNQILVYKSTNGGVSYFYAETVIYPGGATSGNITEAQNLGVSTCYKIQAECEPGNITIDSEPFCYTVTI
jgi:hypothetical protein